MNNYKEMQNALSELLNINFERLKKIPNGKTDAYKKGILDCKSRLHNYEKYEKTPTEQQILKKFEELGYELKVSNNGYLIEFFNEDEMSVIKIDKKSKRYIKVDCVYYSGFVPIFFQEHQLLHELFTVWGWFDEN